jgi:hypothetical protein
MSNEKISNEVPNGNKAPSALHRQQQTVTAPVVNGVATSNALKGAGSVTVHQSPPAHDQAGWAGVSDKVSNGPTTSI